MSNSNKSIWMTPFKSNKKPFFFTSRSSRNQGTIGGFNYQPTSNPLEPLGTPMVFLHSSFRRRDDLATESARRKRLGGKSCWVPRTCKLNYYLQRRYLSIQLQFVSLMSFYHQHDKVHVVLEELFIL